MISALVTLGLAAYVIQPAYTQMFDSEEHWEDIFQECQYVSSILIRVLFSFLMALEAILTSIFDQRRYNTTRKVQKHKQQSQSQDGEVELVDVDDGKFEEPESYDGKIEA
ncbi:hypothetical protein BG015_007817 [Linnemannia schmuckeri]|uniref:Uncharacterized protein n=1 Tax=Linnemannia schmuckeri TaxID=64567 RepID=A0A9P5VB08_9FUNG|nr:hypothetical protein BG015_007817 [Linnemannia schmuckeri]